MGRHAFRPLAILAVLGFLGTGPSQAQKPGQGSKDKALVIFKDGFYVSGRVTQPKSFITDPETGASFTIPLAGSFFYVEDGVRRVHFSPKQVLEVLEEDPKREKNLMALGKNPFSADKSLPSWEMESAGEWDEKWERMLTGIISRSTGASRISMQQRLVYFTPEFAWVSTKHYAWMPCYYTKEIGPAMTKSLLYKYFAHKKEFAGMKDLKESTKQLLIFKFLYQAGWLDLAEKELKNFKERFPSFKATEEVKTYEESLKKQQANVFIDSLLLAHKAGQPEEVRKSLAQYDKEEIGKQVPERRLKVQEIKNECRTKDNKLKEATRLIAEMPARASGANKAFFTKAAEVIAEELNLDTVGRLETFIEYAKQYERETGLVKTEKTRKKGKPSQSADEILALAVSGWLQGDILASTDVPMARSLWGARAMVLEYQKAEDSGTRKQILDSFSKENVISVDVMDRLIKHLPPPDAYEKIGKDLIKLTIGIAGPAQGTTYLVKLPPEYHHARPYPVLFVLNAGGDTPEATISRLADLAAKNGYILVAPVWASGIRFQYNYTAKEHAAVTDCLRDLRRKFQIDSDRVFMFGWRQGGNMAFDVGLSHPDLFAGVLTMNGSPLPYAMKYWPNAQYLPFYCVDGETNGKFPTQHRQLFKDWIRGHYPALYIEYKGRGSEWFYNEFPVMFDWMNRKTRAAPEKQLGLLHTGGALGEEFRTNRETDNHFYWLSTDSIAARHLAGPAAMKSARPATLQASIIPGNYLNVKKGVAVKNEAWNQINVRAYGVNQVTVSIGPKMIDWNLPVRFRVNSSVMGRDRMVVPSLATLLEDFYAQGDRQRLVYVKLEARFK